MGLATTATGPALAQTGAQAENSRPLLARMTAIEIPKPLSGTDAAVAGLAGKMNPGRIMVKRATAARAVCGPQSADHRR